MSYLCKENNIFDGNIFKYDDVSTIMSYTTFENLTTACNNVKFIDNLDLLHTINDKTIQEFLNSIINNIISLTGKKKIFGYYYWTKPSNVSSTSFNHLSKSRSLLCIIKILNNLMFNSNCKIILCALDIAILLLKPFKSSYNFQFFDIDCENVVKLSVEDSKWLVRNFLNFVYIALSNTNQIIEIAGLKLALSIASLSNCAMLVIKELIDHLFSYHTRSSDVKNKTSEDTNVLFEKNLYNRLRQKAIELITTFCIILPIEEFNLNEVCKLVILPGLTDLKLSVSN